MLLETLLLRRRQFAVQVAHQEIDDFFTGHAPSPRKWGSSRVRRAWRARCRRVLDDQFRDAELAGRLGGVQPFDVAQQQDGTVIFG